MDATPRLVGKSLALQKALELAHLFAPTNLPVLITGETGTGKELMAAEMHRLSPRADRPFIKINCAAIATGIAESELFGHEKGAFTGAISLHRGVFEMAHRGTLFLDEIAELPLDLQAKLLRAVNDREIRRVGSVRPEQIDARMVTATNRNLFKAVKDGLFREDLYYRLAVFPIRMPALREHPEDIPLLVEKLSERQQQRLQSSIRAFSSDALDHLSRHPWPGNVRQLETIICRVLRLCQTTEVQLEHVLVAFELDDALLAERQHWPLRRRTPAGVKRPKSGHGQGRRPVRRSRFGNGLGGPGSYRGGRIERNTAMSKENPFIVPKPDHSSAPKEPVEQGNPQKRRVRELAVALRRCKGTIPKGDFCVDAEALRQARAATPAGELHSLRSSGGCIPSAVGSRCVSCGQRHLSESCSSTVTLNA